MSYSRLIFFIYVFFVLGLVAGCSQNADDREQSETKKSSAPDPGQLDIRFVRVLPSDPRGAVELEAEVIFWGVDPDKLSYRWLRGGEPINGETSPKLAPSHIRKGDEITVDVKAEWQVGKQASATSEPVEVGNVGPVAHRVQIQPRSPGTADQLTAVPTSCDFDGDHLDHAYEWTVNGNRIYGQDSETLPNKFFRRGDRVEVTSTPFDDTDRGETLRATVQIQSTAPKIVSPAIEIREAGPFRQELEAVDPDDDLVRFRFDGVPPVGMRLDEAAGVLEWDVPKVEESMTYELGLVADDGHGATGVQKLLVRLVPRLSVSE